MNTFTKIMLSEAEKHLIDIAEEEEGINEALSGIRAFRLSVLGSFTKSTLDELESKGFDFRSKGITSRRAELRVFVESHPACMAESIDALKEKIFYTLTRKEEERIYQKQLTEKTKQKKPKKEDDD